MREGFAFPDDGDRLLSMKEAAARLRTSDAFISRLVNTGLLPCLKFRKNRRIRKFALNDFLKKHEGQDLYNLVETAEAKEIEKAR